MSNLKLMYLKLTVFTFFLIGATFFKMSVSNQIESIMLKSNVIVTSK